MYGNYSGPRKLPASFDSNSGIPYVRKEATDSQLTFHMKFPDAILAIITCHSFELSTTSAPIQQSSTYITTATATQYNLQKSSFQMFIIQNARDPQISTVHGESAAPSQRDQDRIESSLTQGGSINPQLAVTPQTLRNTLSNTQVEDFTVSALIRTAPATLVWTGLPITRNKTASELSQGTKRTLESSPPPSPKLLKEDLPLSISENGLSATKLTQISKSLRNTANVLMKVGRGPPEFVRGVETPADDIFRPPDIVPTHRSVGSTIAINDLHQPTKVPHPVERPPKLAKHFEDQWETPLDSSDITYGYNKSQKEWNPAPVLFGESVSSPGITIIDDLAEIAVNTGDIADADQDLQPRLVSRLGAPTLPAEHFDDKEGEAEDEFNLAAVKKTIGIAFQKLNDIKMQAMKKFQDERALINLQNSTKINVVKVILDWIPRIHLAILAIKPTSDPANAHKCLMYAARTINRLETPGNNYDLEDLKYGVSFNLRSEQGKVIKNWKDISGYQPYGILVWIWRDLCLSILLEGCHDEQSSGAMVSHFLGDIKNCIPLDTYDFRQKKEILSCWDLFLSGGLLATRKGSTKNRVSDPAYWSASFIKAKKRLDQLYCAYRLDELRMYPSVELYRTIKNIFPGEYKKEAIEVVKNKCSPSTIDAQIDIFVFERNICCLERLLEGKLLERGSKRFRDVLVSFSHMRKAENEWARKHMLVGFEEVVEALSNELLRIFPNVHAASNILNKGKDMEEHTESWFVKEAREGYNEEVANSTSALITTRVGAGNIGVYGVTFGHILAAYLSMGLRWGGGASCPARGGLVRDMKEIFLSKLGIIFQPTRWVGEALKNGCKLYQARELLIALEYLLGDFGFQKILNFEEVKKIKARRGRPSLKPPSKNTTPTVSRGVTVAKAKEKRHPEDDK